jgi:toxin ParE1/3/4
MRKYKLAPLADEDLAEIVATTIGRWGYEQAKEYAQLIDGALSKLAEYPDIGRQRADVYANARSLPVEKHIVFYQVCEGGIEVARILHQRMDPLKHLK